MLSSLVLGVILGFALSIAPGPIAVAFMKKAVVGEFRPAFMLGLGAATMDILFNLLAAFASSALVVQLSNLFQQNRWLSLLFQIACVIVLIVLGIRYSRQRHIIAEERHVMEQEAEQERRATKLSHGSPFFLGVMLAITNLATPTFFPSMVAAVSYLHAEGFLMRDMGSSVLYALGFGIGTTVWFIILLRFFAKHRTKLSPGFINTMFKVAGATFLAFAAFLVYNVASSTLWSRLF